MKRYVQTPMPLRKARIYWMLWLLLATALFASSPIAAKAQSAIAIADSTVKIDYPTRMLFHVSAKSNAAITTISLAVRFPASGTTTRLTPKFTSDTQVDATIEWQLGRDASSTALGGYLPPGAQGEYSWHVEDGAGNKLDSPFQSFHVLDNRRNWESLSNDKIAIYWYGQDAGAGKQIFDRANQVLGAIETDIGATVTSQVQIFVYGDRNDFLTALQPGNHEWAGGTIDSTFGIVWIDGTEGLDYSLMVIPHELTHIIIAQALKGPYQQIGMPLWMNEGLAVYHQFAPPHDEARFDQALSRGIQTDSLFRLHSLEENFPNDEGVVDMAYGESFSVIDFMLKQYGTDKMKQMMALFKAGSTPDETFQKGVGVDEDGLENLWRQSVGARTKQYAKPATVTPGAIPTMLLSSAETPGAPTVTPAPVAVVDTPQPAPSSAPTPRSAGGGPGGLCGGAFGGFALVGWYAWRIRRRAT